MSRLFESAKDFRTTRAKLSQSNSTSSGNMDLRINYQETISVGNQVSVKAEEFKNLLSRIRNVNSRLETAWQGTDASKYTNAVEEQTVYMDKLGEAMNEIGNFLVKVGNAYQEASQANANAIR